MSPCAGAARAWRPVVALLAIPCGLRAQEPCRTVSVDGRETFACVSGEGPPTLVLAAGAGLTSSTWAEITPSLTAFARVVTFDRAGMGRSAPGPEPRTPGRIARELRALLDTLGVDGPLILVGHSMGGLHVLGLAELIPDHVRAVVLLDTPPPGFEADRLTLLTEAERVERQRLLAHALVGAPEVVRLEREGARAEARWDFPGFPRHVPLNVVAADTQDFGDLGSEEAHRRLWVERSRRWLALSDTSRFVVADGSGHMVQRDRPSLVVDLLRDIVSSAR